MNQSQAANSDWDRNAHVSVRLISSVAAVGNLDSVPLGLEFEIKKGWKIYWRNPGDAGYPPQPDWNAPLNIQSSVLSWPRPDRFSILGLESLGYKDHVILPLAVRPIKRGAAIRLKGDINYLTCADICIPYTAHLDFSLSAGDATPTQHAQDLNKFTSQIPLTVKVNQQNPAGLVLVDTGFKIGVDDQITLKMLVHSTRPVEEIEAIVEGPMGSYFNGPKASISTEGTTAIITITGGGITEEQRASEEITVTLWSKERAIETTTLFKSGVDHIKDIETNPTKLVSILLIALLGGLILNLMPCVLPVLSLKILSVLEQGGSSHRKIRLSFLATTSGILCAFLILAVTLIFFQQAGYAIGWGIQFQHPYFLLFMIFIILGFAANLLGYFEVTLPTALATKAVEVENTQSGFLHHFLTGVFATLLATPCSAPFLGTAIGFAFSQGPTEILLIFMCLGIGLAAPFMIFMIFPSLARKLPKPGKWMIWVKYVLSGALIITALWLTTVLTMSLGAMAAWTAFALSLLMLAGLYVRKNQTRKSIRYIYLIPLLAGFTLPLLPFSKNQTEITDLSSGHINWQVFEEDKIRVALSAGKTVFVDVTADWCITCQYNKSTVLSDADLSAWLNSPDVVSLKADWTLPNDDISAYLAKNGRYGIPFNIIYSPTHPTGIALPELLSVQNINQAISKSHQEIEN